MAQKTHGNMGPAKRPVGKRLPAEKSPVSKGVSSSKTKGSSSTKKKKIVPARKRKVAAKKKRIAAESVHKPAIPKHLRSVIKEEGEKIWYYLDTNIIMHHSNVIFQFDEHNVVLCSQVWSELDVEKSRDGSSSAPNVRATVRYLAELVSGKTEAELEEGVTLLPPAELVNGKPHTGKIFWDFSNTDREIRCNTKVQLDPLVQDHRILMSCLKMKAEGKNVVLVTNDLNFRVLAAHAGVVAEEYFSEVIEMLPSSIDDVLLGFHQMDEDIWDSIGDDVNSKHVMGGVVEYEMKSSKFKDINPNEFLVFPDNNTMRVISKPSPYRVVARALPDNYLQREEWGIVPRNFEQRLVRELLIDQSLPGVLLEGGAGSGKTFMALVHGLQQIEKKVYNKLIISRVTTSVDDIGFLPGTEEEKMSPWLAAFTDNLEVLFGCETSAEKSGEKDKKRVHTTIQQAIDQYNIQFKAMNFMRGRSISNAYIIIDEGQNLTNLQLKLIATRVGPGSKIVILGNTNQIDNKYVTEYTCGISIMKRKLRHDPLFGHLTLQEGERSPFATLAEKLL